MTPVQPKAMAAHPELEQRRVQPVRRSDPGYESHLDQDAMAWVVNNRIIGKLRFQVFTRP